MPTHLPSIFTAGQFDSKVKFSDPIKYPDNSISRPRIVNCYEIELFPKDDGVLYLNEKSYTRKKGALLIARPGDKRQSTLHFHATFLHFGCNDPSVLELIHSISGFHSGLDYEKLFPALLDICNTALSFEPDSDIFAAAKLIAFLCEIKKSYLLSSSSTDHHSSLSVVSDAVEYMKQHYMHPLTINKIADYCCLSTSYFYKIFLEAAHTTPNNYLLQIRLAHAKTLLVKSTMPISVVAGDCGFNSQAYFSDCFKKQFGATPREFRNSFSYPDVKI